MGDLSRRRVLELALGITLAGCDDCGGARGPAPATTASVGAKSSRRRADVVIVGAGMAGLAAAARLREKGAEVIVLEARERAGGRIWTNRSLGVPFDLGASWIHGHRGNPLTDMAEELRLKTVGTDYGSVHLYDHDGRVVPEGETEEILEGWQEVQGEVAELSEELDHDISLSDGVERALGGEKLSEGERRLAGWVLATQEVAAGEDLARLSLLGDETDGFPGRDLLIPAGYDQVVRAIGKDVDVRLKHPVTSVRHGDDGVVVSTEAGEFEAEYAIVTVPLGVLKRGAVTFHPPLDAAKQRAIAKLGMGTLNKVAMVFEETFWPTDRDFLGYASKRHGEFPVFLNAAKIAKKPALIAFAGGSFARGLEKKDDASIQAEIMTILGKMFGSKASPPVKTIVTRWASDSWSFGAYSHVPVGATSKLYDVLAKPVGRLRFAGEATHSVHASTVHGALLSGRREAEAIIAEAG